MAAVFQKQKRFDLLLAFLMPMLLFFLILFRNQIVPFGDKTLLFSDLDSQYVEFMAEYRRVLLGEGSLSWSWHAGLGMNFPAIIAYYLASPFNFLLVLFPENQLPLAVTVLTTLKLGCIGAAFAFHVLRHYKTPGPQVVIAAVCYALSAYALGYAFNIMWLDALIWLPLLCTGIDRLLDSGKKSMAELTFLFALSFLSQFYMSWMMGFFSVLYLLTCLVNRKDTPRSVLKNLLRFVVCVGIAAGLSAFLLLPTFFVLKNNMGSFGQDIPSAARYFSVFSLVPKLFIGSFDGIKDCLPHIYCGIPAIIGIVLYFTGSRITLREKITSALITAFLLISFCFSPLNFFWHAMDHPSWFPYRYAFLFCFWILRLSCAGFSADITGKRICAAGILCACLILWSSFIKDSGKASFVLYNGTFLSAYILLICYRGKKNFGSIFLIITMLELFLNGSMIIAGNRNGYTALPAYRTFHEHYKALTDAVQPEKTEFYRMEKSIYRNYNDPMGIGFPGISHFSSTANTRQAQYLKRLGFNCYATWCNYQGATEATDAMLRIRYEFGKGGKSNSVQAGDETWEHTAVFPLFYFAGENYIRYDFFNDADAITRQNDLLLLLSGEENKNYFEPVPVKNIHMENLKPDNSIITNYKRIDPDQRAWLDIEAEPVDQKSLYLFLPDASLSYTVTINDSDKVMDGNKDYAPFPICLDPYTAGGKAKIRIETLKDTLSGGVLFYALDSERLNMLSEKINAAAPEIQKTSETSFILKTEPSAQDRIIVSSIPFDAGWRVISRGEQLPLKAIHESVLGFILPAGYEEAEITYRPYGTETGMILSGAALLLWLTVTAFEYRKKRDNQS